MSIPMKLACAAVRLTRTKQHYRSKAWMRAEYLQRSYPVQAPVSRSVRKLCTVEESMVGGFRTVTLRPRSESSDASIIYLHGGTYINELVRPHWSIIAELIRRTGATVTVPFYPLAPEHTFGEAFEYLETVYARVLETAASDDVVLAGDSAGGGLSVGMALHLQAAGLPRPGRLLLLSPWADITGTNPELPAYEKVDPMLAIPGAVEAGSWWAGKEDPRHPLLSPVYAPAADLALLPPVDIHQGERDMCMPDAAKLAARINDAGGTAALTAYPGAFHVFMALPWLPESKAVYDDVERVVRTTSGERR
ncbi:alpha/beta hydrolase fold domain-containing protein [Arthrobacter sp. H14]|uniref:alpha/beta hydrolase fold domain-containing protein n=1 Tax=Arthrobacter sp. H14 TaxID=1312959 RepID=UPI0009DF5584|nr:alpha/beta hydrolase [Arthrobacter sp. H14]